MSDLRADRAVASFDSASAMVGAVARAVRGEDFAHLGHGPVRALPVRMSGYLPVGPRRTAYALLGGAEGVPADRLGDVDMAPAAEWVVRHYDRRRTYPGVVVGSSNGAAVHLCAATGMPWLPQTLLVPVRWSDNDPDDPAAAMEFGRRVAPPLLRRNPDVVLYHMHDGNQDRLMVGRMTYFRLKWTRLPWAYEDFLRAVLRPGAPVVVLDDTSTWPTTEVGERHVFQTGAQGGINAEEYLDGSPRVSAFLRAQRSPRGRFAAPEPDGRSPEAEWGFEPALGDAVETWAGRAGHPVVRIRVPSPQALAGPVADLMRGVVRSAGGTGNRLLVESFAVVDPVQAFRSGSVPFWTFFPVLPGLRAAVSYVAGAASAGDPYVDADVLVFPHGVASAGVATPADWAELGPHLRGQVRLLRGTAERWPAHFDTLARFGPALRRLPGGVRPGRGLGCLAVDAALRDLAAAGITVQRGAR